MTANERLQIRIGELVFALAQAEQIIEEQYKEIEALKLKVGEEPHQEMLENR